MWSTGTGTTWAGPRRDLLGRYQIRMVTYDNNGLGHVARYQTPQLVHQFT